MKTSSISHPTLSSASLLEIGQQAKQLETFYLLHLHFQSQFSRVSVQGVKSFGGHFACLCRGVDFYRVKKKSILFFKKKREVLSHFYIILILKSLQKEQNRTNLLLWPPICWNKPAITQKWFNSLDTNCTCNYGIFSLRKNCRYAEFLFESGSLACTKFWFLGNFKNLQYKNFVLLWNRK